jgi:hypothetical protein
MGRNISIVLGAALMSAALVAAGRSLRTIGVFFSAPAASIEKQGKSVLISRGQCHFVMRRGARSVRPLNFLSSLKSWRRGWICPPRFLPKSNRQFAHQE